MMYILGCRDILLNVVQISSLPNNIWQHVSVVNGKAMESALSATQQDPLEKKRTKEKNNWGDLKQNLEK